MKAVLLKEFGGPEVLLLGEMDRPSPGPDQVLIRVMATSVNRPDIIQRLGHYPPPPGESEILGLEVAGIIEQLGPQVTGWEVGDRVMSLVGGGAYAEYANAYADHLMSIPEPTSFSEAACVCETYITAYLNLFMLGGLKESDTTLLHGGGGGVNTAAIQLCKTLVPKAKIVVTASTGKLERVQALGADLVIDYKKEDFAERVKSYTQNKGVDVILDHVGAAYLFANLKSLAIGGRLVEIGVMGGPKAELNIALLMVKRQQIIGSVLRPRPVAEKASITQKFSEVVLPLLSNQVMTPLIHKIYSLDEVRQAHECMEAGSHFGKIVLEVRAV